MTLQRLIDHTLERSNGKADLLPNPNDLYIRVDFPEPGEERPYLFINMVSTADGKIVIGERDASAKGVGGPTDQVLFRRLQKAADAAMIGGATLRASQVIYPPDKPRFVVTRTGDVPLDNRFFRDAPERAFVLAPQDLAPDVRAHIEAQTNLIAVGRGGVDMSAALRILRQEHGIRHLLCEGGAVLNDELIRAGLVDEWFLSFAPKLKGGGNLPTPLDGQGFPPGQFCPLTLLSLYHDGDEFYFRYRLECRS